MANPSVLRPAADFEKSVGKRTIHFLAILFKPSRFLVLLAFLIGTALRVWNFGNLPSGLGVDEASIGVEAASLYRYGIDRNGKSFPVHFISWGGGQNVLYAYLLAPLTPLGLSPFIIRLPMLISGLLTLAVVYGIARKLFSPSVALWAIFLLAISPWHIMISRWALESNLFPFIFSLAFLCLLNADRNPLWYIASTALLAISLYAYGTAYFLVPLFVFLIAVFLFIKPIISRKFLLSGIAVFSFLSIPIVMFILINAFGGNEIHIGVITIPRVISEPRFIAMTGFLHGAGIQWYCQNLLATAKILFSQTDGLIWNSLPPYGFLFPGAILFALVGAVLAADQFWKQKTIGMWALGAWLVLAFLLGIIQEPEVQRINILFIPLILCAAVTVDWIIRDKRILMLPVFCSLAAYTVLFWRAYIRPEYQNSLAWELHNGLIPSIQSVEKFPDKPVCVTNELDMPYIYVELVELKNPKDILAEIKYQDPNVIFRIVEKMGKYSFGIQNCQVNQEDIFILKNNEKLPLDESLFTAQIFGDYVVYVPRRND